MALARRQQTQKGQTVDDDRGLTALPKLVGGPRYSRPPVPATKRLERPPDPDDLPLVSERTPEDQALAQDLGLERSTAAMVADGGGGGSHADHPGNWSLTAGATGAGSPPRRRGRGLGSLFLGRNGRSGIG